MFTDFKLIGERRVSEVMAAAKSGARVEATVSGVEEVRPFQKLTVECDIELRHLEDRINPMIKLLRPIIPEVEAAARELAMIKQTAATARELSAARRDKVKKSPANTVDYAIEKMIAFRLLTMSIGENLGVAISIFRVLDKIIKAAKRASLA
jgi:hypothetical protein